MGQMSSGMCNHGKNCCNNGPQPASYKETIGFNLPVVVLFRRIEGNLSRKCFGGQS